MLHEASCWGCAFLQEWPDNPELATWVRRQRALNSQGQLSAERHQILNALGFEFGEGAHITQEWESNFDQLVDWLLWQVRAHCCAASTAGALAADRQVACTVSDVQHGFAFKTGTELLVPASVMLSVTVWPTLPAGGAPAAPAGLQLGGH